MTQATVENIKPGMILINMRNCNDTWPAGLSLRVLHVGDDTADVICLSSGCIWNRVGEGFIEDFDIAEGGSDMDAQLMCIAALAKKQVELHAKVDEQQKLLREAEADVLTIANAIKLMQSSYQGN